MVLGHEITGEVVEVGTDVEYIKKGDLVHLSLSHCPVHASIRARVLRLVRSTAPPLQELTGARAHSARCRSTSLAGVARRASAATRVSASTSTPHARAPPTGASPFAPLPGDAAEWRNLGTTDDGSSRLTTGSRTPPGMWTWVAGWAVRQST
jgi:hypothetical protein